MYDVGTPEYEARRKQYAKSKAEIDKALDQELTRAATGRSMDKPDTPHYQQAEIEPIDYIRGLGPEVFAGFCTGNVIKYVTRAPYKGTRVEDLRKARQYLDWLIASVDE